MNERLFAWQVPLAHPAFAGHFPGRPILPGVVLLDRALFLAQTQVDADADGCVGKARDGEVGWKVSQAKFLSPVVPGEDLNFAFTPDARGGWRFAVQAADGRAVAAGSLSAPNA